MTSKLVHGNMYALKERDQRGVVTALYILDPNRVRPLVADDGSIYYELSRDNLTGLQDDRLVVPAKEIIHDVMVPLYHPLCGVSPIAACGLPATQGLAIQNNSTRFFQNGGRPGGIITAPGHINEAMALRLKAHWESSYSGENMGKTAVLGDGLQYQPIVMSNIDAQLVEQLRMTAETVCSAFHVPAHMVGVGPAPTYNNIEALNQEYYSQCLQAHIESIELLLDEGLELPKPFGTEFDLDGLLRMDSKTKAEAARQAIQSGVSPNEIRKKYFDLGPTAGGETPYLQEQQWPLRHLAERPCRASGRYRTGAAAIGAGRRRGQANQGYQAGDAEIPQAGRSGTDEWQAHPLACFGVIPADRRRALPTILWAPSSATSMPWSLPCVSRFWFSRLRSRR